MNKNNKKHKKNKKRKTTIFLKILFAITIILVMLLAGFLGYSTYKNGWGVKGIIQTAMGQSEKKLANLEPFTVLILGVSKDISVELTDTIMVASYNPKTQKATLLSIPRDTFVGKNNNTATSYDKINALYQKSPEKTLDAVKKLTGLDITYYIVVSNDALVQLVDTIGGVDYNVPIDMKYDDCTQDLYIDLKAGPQKLNGQQAEWLVRFRHNNNGTTYPSEYGNNDLGRMRTQREFLTEVVKQTVRLKNITKLGTFVDILKENVKTNIKNWNLLKDYIPYIIDFNTENLQAAAIPGIPATYNKLSFFVHNQKETEALIKELMLEQNGTTVSEFDNLNSNNTTNTNSTNTSTNKTNSTTTTNTTKNNTNTTNSTKSNTTKTNTTKNETTNSSTNTKSNIKIELLNGSGESSLLTKATKALKAEGYNVYKTGTTTITSKTTLVNKTSVPSATMQNIKKLLSVGNISNSSSSSSTVDVTIIIGKDYK